MNYFIKDNNNQNNTNNTNNELPKLDDYHGDNINKDFGNLDSIIDNSNDNNNYNNTSFFTDYGQSYVNNTYNNNTNNEDNTYDYIDRDTSVNQDDLNNLDNLDTNNNTNNFDDYFTEVTKNDVKLETKKNNKNKSKILKIIAIILSSLIVLILILYFLPIPIIVSLDGNGVVDNKKSYCFATIMDFNCTLTLKEINNTDGKKYIYNYEPDNHKMLYKGNDTIEVNKWFKLYVVEEEKIKYTAYFDKNGSSKLSKEIISCEGYASDGGCNITFPTITRSTYTILGFSKNKDNRTSEYNVGESYKLTERESTYYAITKKDLIALFSTINNSKQLTSEMSCTVFNKETNCNITVPKFKIYGNNYGEYDVTYTYYTNKNTLSKYLNSGDSLELNTSDILIKNKYSKVYYTEVISNKSSLEMSNSWINKITTLGKTNIVYDKSCSAKNDYESFMNTLYNNAPYLFNKITNIQFYSRNNFNRTTNQSSGVVGITYSNSILISCDSTKLNSFDYLTVVHEIAHAQHNRLFSLTKESDFIKPYRTLLNSYYYAGFKRPLRSYSYTNEYEFIAELFSYYYMTTYGGYTTIDYYNPIDSTLTNEAKKLECYFKSNNLSEINKCK